MKKKTRMYLQFLRTVKFPRFIMTVGEVWDCYEEWGTGKDYLDAVAKGEDRFPFAGGYCFVIDVEATSI